MAAQSLDRKIRQKMKKILITAAILILGAVLGVGSYLAYQHFSDKKSSTTKPTVTVKDEKSGKEGKTEFKHRLDMELAITDAEKEFFAMMNNYFDAIDKAVEDKQHGRKTDFKKINLLEAKIGVWFLFNEDKIRKELMRKELLPLAEYYEQITKKYGIDKGLKENALIKIPEQKKNTSGLISGPHHSCTTSSYVKNGIRHDSIVICDTYLYETKMVAKKTSYVKVDLNDYFNPEEADWNCTGLNDEEWEYLHNKNVFRCDTTICNQKLKGWYHINKWTETKDRELKLINS